MIIIVDVNKIFSAIFKPNGAEGEVLTSKSNIQFIAPDYLLEEINSHLDEIARALQLSRSATKASLSKIIQRLQFVAVSTIPKTCVSKAIEIVHDVDLDDALYVALHLLEGHKIWTGDRVLIEGLKRKGYDICITTSALKLYLYKK